MKNKSVIKNEVKIKRIDAKIIGYVCEKDDERAYPIFDCEGYKGKIYRTAKEAKEARK